VDTSLRYTDILFGFVIRELFLRLQNWSQLPSGVRWHLIVGTTLVLGSWIGFRRSLNRTTYEVKFFNLPLFRFLIDQLMLILYFRIAVLTKVDGTDLPTTGALSTDTTKLAMYVFILYAIWDLLGIWMAKAKTSVGSASEKPRYPALKCGKMTDDWQRADWAGFSITASGLAVLTVLWWTSGAISSNGLSLATVVLLLAYRFAKETRTSWRSLQSA
jgi:hypothetical protein